MRVTRVSRHLKASRASVYRALIDVEAVARWKVPTGMTCRVHADQSRAQCSLVTGRWEAGVEDLRTCERA